MRVLALDTETTGLDVKKDRIIEFGAVLYDTFNKYPQLIYSKAVQPGGHVLPEGYRSPTGLSGAFVGEFGIGLGEVVEEIRRVRQRHAPEAIVGHNIVGYDLPLWKHELDRLSMEDPLEGLAIIDTRHDLPFPTEPTSRRLVHVSAEFGRFINPYEHRAIFDCMACLKLLDMFPFQEVLANSKLPWVILRAKVDYDNRQKAKDLRFTWEEAANQKFPKCWVKAVRDKPEAIEREMKAAQAIGVEVIRILA